MIEETGHSDDQILILGGGFAGLFTALYLGGSDCPLPIKLIDRKSRFIFKPLLYEFLSGEIQAEAVCPDYEELLRDRGVTHILGNIQSIDLQNQRVELDSGMSQGYQYLVIALGDAVGYFDIPGAEDYTFTFRSEEDALSLRAHLQQQQQQAMQTEDTEQRQALLTTAIVGAGPSGVELAATLADFLPNCYAELGGNAEEIRIVLLQRNSDILQDYIDRELRETVKEAMAKRQASVELLFQAIVESVEPGTLNYQQADEHHSLNADTIIWTAGSETHPLIKTLPIQEIHRDPRGRPYVTSALQLIGFPNVFAGGDCAVDVRDPKPETAQIAYRQGQAIAHNIKALIDDRQPEPVDIAVRGNLMKLGLEESVAEMIGKVKISGQVGHLIRRATYLGLLPTPTRNLKLGAEWIANEIFDQFTGT